jgi:transcriptional regulator with XRE-family HTH domain
MKEKASDALPEDAELDPVLVALGRRLLRARLRYGERMDPPKVISQAHIGRLVDVTGVTIGAWEAGKNDPGTSMLHKLAEIYGVRLAWLASADGEMYESPGDEGEQGAKPINGAPKPRIPVVAVTADQFVTKRIPVPDEPRRSVKKRRPGKGRSAMAG